MESFETRQYLDKNMRDTAFARLRAEGEPNERQVVKYSNPETEMIDESEFRLDNKGRIVYRTRYYLAYPKEIHGHRARRRAEKA